MWSTHRSNRLTTFGTFRCRLYRSLAFFLFIAVGSAAIPVCDIRGVDSLNYSKQEKIIRCKTASLYRLADIFGMSNSLITVSLTSTHTYTRTLCCTTYTHHTRPLSSKRNCSCCILERSKYFACFGANKRTLAGVFLT